MINSWIEGLSLNLKESFQCSAKCFHCILTNSCAQLVNLLHNQISFRSCSTICPRFIIVRNSYTYDLHVGLSWSARHLWPMILKETPNSFKKWPLYLWWISNKTIMVVGNATKAATFLHQSYKKHTIILFVTVLFNIFMRQIY